MANLTHSLGDKLKEALGEDLPTPRRNPKSGFDAVKAQTVSGTGDKNNEEAGTASHQHNDNQNNSMEDTNMSNVSSFGIVNPAVPSNGTTEAHQPTTKPLDQALAEAAVVGGHAMSKIATDGVKLEFKRRDKTGAILTGAAVGGILGGAAAGTAMALLPVSSTNEDIINAAATGFSAGLMLGAVGGFLIADRGEGKTEKK